MSKHLRFKSLLGALAIMLALGMSWTSVSAQNLSSEKVLMTFALDGIDGVPGTAERSFDVTVPFGTDVTAMVATFTMSEFANAFVGVNPTTGVAAVSGTSPATDYTSPVVWTIEAENHSYDNYTITVKFADALEGNDITTMDAAYNKDIPGACWTPDPVLMDTDVVDVDIDGTDITVMVEFGADLSDITLYATLSQGATVVPAIATTGTAFDFTGGDIDFTVTSQKGVNQVYTVTIEVGDASVLDDLAANGFAVAGANSVVINTVNQTIAVEVPASVVVANLKPTWTISEYAVMMDDDPTVAGAAEICSGVSTVGAMQSYDAGTMVAHYWIMAEDNSEVSEWVVTYTNADPSDENDLIALEVSYTKTWGDALCMSTETDTVMAVIDGTDVTISLPFGVTSVTILTALTDNTEISALASMAASDTPLVDGSTITVTAEDGTDQVYTVEFDNAAASNAKEVLTYGFGETVNEAAFAVIDWDMDYDGVIDQGAKRITVEVAWDTDLHDLIAFFTSSAYSTVYIAETTSVTGDPTTYTPQCSDITINDHSNSLTYVVVAEDGTEERYDVSVTKAAALDGTELIDFMLTDLEMCIGDDVDVTAVYDEMDITVTVKYGTDPENLTYSFTLSEGATCDLPLTGQDFTDPVDVTVTAQNGDEAVYTITVVVRDTDMNSVAKINKYWFESLNAMGDINETAKTIHVWVPWGTDVTDLVASFELANEPWTRMTRSEDLTDATENAVCVSGDSPETDFTTPVAYTVFAEDCSTVEYFVTVFITPNVDTGISGFTFDMYGCMCHDVDDKSLLVSKIDPFAKRIYITLPFDMAGDLKKLAPKSITITDGAKIDPAVSKEQDWTKGPVKYTVTAPDGVTKAVWEVWVEAPACQETDIYSFALPEIQVSSSDLNGDYKKKVVTIDYENHTIDVLIKKNANLNRVYYTRDIGCATICCVSGNCVDNHYLDFSESLCHTCVVTAQDESITQEWTICLTEIDTECPTVMTESVLAMNCEDTVYVTPSELGEVFIIHEDAIACIDGTPCNCDPSNPLGDKDLISDLIDEKMLAKVNADTLAATAIPTQGLYSGVYYAYAIDTWGNVSCQSKQKLYIDVCEKEVATLADLKAADPAFMYTVTGEVLVTYEETRSSGNLKYVQDATAGIEIRDLNDGCSETFGLGAGVTGLKGMMMDVNHLSGNDPCDEEKTCSKVFVPICCYSPTVSSKGNVVAPIVLTFEEFAAAPRAYDAMFVRINTPMMLANDYYSPYRYVFDFDEDRDRADLFTWTANGNSDYLVATTLNTNYIGESFPDEPKIYQGINTYAVYNGTCFGTVTPRWVAEKKGDDSDILDVADCLLMADPDPVHIDGVSPGSCSALTDVDIVNEGANKVTITALYLDDMSGQDEFELIFPTPVPFGLDHWGSGNTYTETVQVQFCPKDPGDEEATLVVEYCDGTILEVPIMGTTVSIFDAPYITNFDKDTEGSTLGWTTNPDVWSYGNPGYNFGSGQLFYLWGWKGGVNCELTSPGIIIKDLDNPVLTWRLATYYNSNLYVEVSTDMKKTWTMLHNYGYYTLGNAVGKIHSLSLAAYEGSTEPIFIRFRSDWNNYIGFDDVSVTSLVTTPIYKGNTEAMDLGGVQLGETATATYTVTNIGVSVLEVTKVELTGDAEFTLTDSNVYPFEIHDGTYAYTVDPSGDALSVDVSFAPVAVGSHNAMLKVTYGMYEDHVVMVPVMGEGLSCYTAAEAVLGENFAAGQNSWFTYTAEVFQMAYVTSCDPRNTTDPYEYSYDTYLQIFSDCEGTMIAENDDLEWDACPSNRALSGLLLPMNAGETIKIFWPWMFTSAHDDEGFYFHINATYPVDGDVCETAIALTLPVVNHFGSTVEFEDDYDMSPCSPYSNYMDGNDKVYMINLETDGYLTGNILGAYGSIHVLDMCPKEELEKKNCKAFVGGPNGGEFTKRIAAGEYYVIISTWAPPQTVDYLLNMSFEEGSGIDDNSLANSLSVYPNPTNGQFTVSISNAEATDLTVELVNISGQVVYRNEVKAVYTYNEDIDASEFAKGVYYLKVNDGSEVKVEKVVIQ